MAYHDNHLSPCSCCCVNFGCIGEDGVSKEFPQTLNFILNIAGSCPEASVSTLSATMTWDPAFSMSGLGCADIPECKDFCQCAYTWKIADEDIPHCGPYIGLVALACVVPLDGPPLDPKCPHSKFENCYWFLTVFVFRSQAILSVPPPCTQHIGSPPNWQVQSCVDCTWSCVESDDEPPIHGCCCTCPPCYTGCVDSTADGGCGEGTTSGTPNPLYCFGDGCWEDFDPTIPGPGDENPGDCADPCGPGGFSAGGPHAYRVYSMALRGCTTDPGTGLPFVWIKGCNPSTCPDDARNTGDFFVHIECGNDYFEAACP